MKGGSDVAGFRAPLVKAWQQSAPYACRTFGIVVLYMVCDAALADCPGKFNNLSPCLGTVPQTRPQQSARV